MRLRDFGLIPLNCRLESAFGYLMEIYGILWNACWAYELVQCVKSPMVYSEKNHKYYQGFVYIIGLLFTAAAFTFYTLQSVEPNLVCLMEDNMLFHVFVTAPFIAAVIMNLYVHIVYGRDSFLKTFSTNYVKFR